MVEPILLREVDGHRRTVWLYQWQTVSFVCGRYFEHSFHFDIEFELYLRKTTGIANQFPIVILW